MPLPRHAMMFHCDTPLLSSLDAAMLIFDFALRRRRRFD